MQSLQCPFSLPRSALWGWYFVMRIGGNKFMLKKTRHGLNWKHWNMIEDKSVTCTACMFLVLQLQKFKLKANSKASVGSERSFSEQIQPWSASPIARSSVHVCL